MMLFLLVSACGGLGAVTRFVFNTSIQQVWKRGFPLATFVINLIATFCAGIAAAAFAFHTVDHGTYLLFVTGFLGGFSTFSTAVNEIVSLARDGRMRLAVFYCVLTVVVPLLCVAAGWSLIACTR